VTAVFSDMAGSTSLAEQLDPEAVRRMMSRWFEEARAVLERHGGTVEKYIGDAVMSVFGIPSVNEDDALRAVRAALGIHEAVERLNAEFEAGLGVRLAVRTGVNTGEVVAGDASQGQAFASGDAINVAARLQQAASPGEVLIGETTERLVRHAAELEPREPLELKGKAAPVRAWRVRAVAQHAEGIARHMGRALVGREAELEALERSFQEAMGCRECRMVTLLGPAGMGKSRLAEELVTRVASQAMVARGRCLPYGTMTFWPLREIVSHAAGIAEEALTEEEAHARIAALMPGAAEAETAAQHVAGAVGMCEACSSQPEEVFWAVRRLLESLARERPLMVVFDDIHWAEATLLDLLEYLAGFMRDAPVVFFCLARPMLLEKRAAWAAGPSNASTIQLGPLGPEESQRLAAALLGGALSAGVAERITAAAEGNPLFVEEVLRMLVDEGVLHRANEGWTTSRELRTLAIPPTIQALLAARLDRLPPNERAVVERAAIVGKEFGWRAVAALSPPEGRGTLATDLQTLVRKGLIHPGTEAAPGADAFSFSHIMIRDVAYDGIPKSQRAKLHEAFADSLEMLDDAGTSFDEIAGYHLEQAYSLRRDATLSGDPARLANRAAHHLAEAGRRAYGRGDLAAAIDLLTRAADLLAPADPERLALVPKLADALIDGGDLARAEALLDETAEAATRAGDAGAEAHARMLRLYARSFTHPEEGLEELGREAARAREVFHELGDPAGMARAESALAVVHLSACRWTEAAEARKHELEHARRAGERGLELRALSGLAYALLLGPMPVEDAITEVGKLEEQARGYPAAEGAILGILGLLEAMRGEFDRARHLHRRSAELLGQLGPAPAVAEAALNAGETELLAAEPAAAERHLRPALAALANIGETAILASVAAVLADALYRQGRLDEAEAVVRDCEEVAAADDVAAQAGLRGARAKTLASRGDTTDAERLAREAVRLAERTDDLNLRAGTLVNLAEVLAGHDNDGERVDVLAAALSLYERKGNHAAARTLRAALGRRPEADAMG
jgi:predicted ATPase/class 3 adenylate cyclase